MATSSVRVLLVDDHTIVREGLRTLLHTYPKNIEVVGEAGNGEEAVLSVGELQPAVVVIDIHMPKNGRGRGQPPYQDAVSKCRHSWTLR